MTTFKETNAVVRQEARGYYYAACKAQGCGWVGPNRATRAVAQGDAVRHHESDGS